MEIDTAEKLLDALTLGEKNLPTYKTQIGVTAEEIDENNQDRANLAKALENKDIIEAGSQTATQIKNAVYNGSPADSVAVYPSFTIAALPFPEVKAGALRRWRERRKRWMAANGYTREIGIAVGIDKPAASPASPDSLIAALKASDIGGYQYTVAFQKQGQSAMLIQYRLKGTEKWLEAKTALQSPATIDVDEPAEAGAAVQIEIRGRLLKGNQQVGQWSPIYTLTVNP